MLTWTDCPARTPEEQIIFAQREILRRLAVKAERSKVHEVPGLALTS